MKLRELLAAVPGVSFDAKHPALDAEVKGLSTNSHACKSGDLFLGMPGTRVDGGDFWQSAIEIWCACTIISTQAAEKTPPQPPLAKKGGLEELPSTPSKGLEEVPCVIAAADMRASLRSNSNRILRQSS